MRSIRFQWLAMLAVLVWLCAAAATAGDGFFFVQMADTQLGFTNGNKDLAPEIGNFRRAVEHVNRLGPAFVIISGDLVNAPHDPKQIRAFWQVAHELRPDIPLYLVAGNHDIGKATADSVRRYERLFGKDRYTFSRDSSHFVILNSCLIHDPDSDPGLKAAQRKWFESELAAARQKNAAHIFVCTHHPWFISSVDEADQYENIPQAERKDYLDLVKRFGVDFALAGHYHREGFAREGSLSMITTAAVSKTFGPEPVGFRVFRVRGDKVEHTYYTLDKMPQKIE